MNHHKIKVLIVEDSPTMRMILFEALQKSPEIEIVSYASNGKLAIPRIKHYKPDFVILDHEMPEMNGLETLTELKKMNLHTKIIMFSAHTLEGAEVTIESLKRGAIDFVPKPDFTNQHINPIEYIKKNLNEKILGIHYKLNEKQVETQIKKIPEEKNKVEIHDRIQPLKRVLTRNIEVAGIGISTGGPIALNYLFSNIPRIKKTLFIVQHMPPIFTKKLVETLQKISDSKIVEAEDHSPIEEGTVYIAPGGYHMIIEEQKNEKKIRILDTEPIDNCKPSATVLFESLAEVYGSRAMGIIMTGMGTDGLKGLIKMHEVGSYIIAQNKESCLVYGMPQKPVEMGLADDVLDLDQIAIKIKEYLC